MLFDDSFQALLEEVRRVLGDDALDKTVVHREAAGRLAFFYDGELSSDKAVALENALRERLGPYARPDLLVADRREPAVERVLDEPARQWLPPHGDRRVRYVDRRIVGVDWLAGPPADEVSASPRFVFASLKGGVGRTTALCIAATDLARQGKNVLVVDLDLEAPGVGALLLHDNGAPRLGSIDYLVESTVLEPDRLSALLPDLTAASFHTRPEGGRIDVVPAFGSATKPETGSPWDTLRVVLAKAAPDARQNQWFVEELYALFQEYLYEEQAGLEGFNFREDDPAAPHYPVPIAMNPLFADWDPTRRPDDLTQPFYESSFRPFLDELLRRIETDG